MNRRFSRIFLSSVLMTSTACSTDPSPTRTTQQSTETTKRSAYAIVAANRGQSPHAISGDFGPLGNGERSPALIKAAEAYGVPTSQLVFAGSETDALGMTHARYTQEIDGLPVVGGDLRMHAQTNGRVFLLTGQLARQTGASPRSSIDAYTAEDTAAYEARPGVQLTSAGSDLVYVITDDKAGVHLAYRVTVVGEDEGMPVRDDVFVDANDGTVVARHSHIHNARDRKTHSANNGSSLPGTLVRAEGQAASSNVDVNAAYDNTGLVYDYYFTSFGRDSFDNAGAVLSSTVNYGRNYCNAFWDSRQMVYGDGDGRDCGPLARALDVTGHELTHAVTEHTANLIYSGESGGLNEAYSDIFGNVIEATRDGAVSQNTWLVGEEIWTPNTPGDALRYMDDPAKDGSSLDMYGDDAGNVDVHYNSGIANLAFKVLVTGGTHPRGQTTAVAVGVGVEKAAAIFYRALATYLTASSDFEAARTATAQAAADLYDAQTVAAVHLAWDVVAVPGGPNAPPVPEPTTLENGVPQSVAGASRSKAAFKIDVPAGARITVRTAGGTGDADLYVAFGRKASAGDNDAASTSGTSDESVTVTASAAGTLFVQVYGYRAFADVTLTVSY